MVYTIVTSARHGGQHLPGGTAQLSITTVTECHNTCNQTLDCFAFDWNSDTETCWFHSATSLCGTLFSQAWCTHYKFYRCGKNSKY